ncbi:hypothetical protein QAD02_010796 [Eretmocerus hayati]|uniref:Uncharacterized protein n=1 Tax=Eretmocerus hayati TaxID=131215 RepID=A0ACC2NUS3_9HYME|nr:hypothetical protein QAD02_010796 [Eretmocerus hayati]
MVIGAKELPVRVYVGSKTIRKVNQSSCLVWFQNRRAKFRKQERLAQQKSSSIAGSQPSPCDSGAPSPALQGSNLKPEGRSPRSPDSDGVGGAAWGSCSPRPFSAALPPYLLDPLPLKSANLY